MLKALQYKRGIAIGAFFLTLTAVGAVAWLYSGKPNLISGEPTVVTDTIEIPNTERIVGGEGRFIEERSVQATPLMPKNDGEQVIVVGAELTAKESYELAKADALEWAPDAKLVFIKSLGSVMLDGKSSYWQIGFGSAAKKKGYDAIVQGSTVVEKKEVTSTTYGYDEPKNFYDSKDAIDTIRTLSHFKDATITQVNLYYNTDGKVWSYALATSRGVTSVPIK